MNLENTANIIGTTPTDTVAVQSKLSTSEMKRYEVSFVAEAQMILTGYATVYAADPDEAVEKVQAQIDS